MIVYLITNDINGKQYIGQTIKKLNLRWNEHTSSKSKGALQRAIRKYKKENFSLAILHVCESKEEMDFVETFYISLLNTRAHVGYNLTDGGEGIPGAKRSEVTRKKISLAAMGNKNQRPRAHSEHTKELIKKSWEYRRKTNPQMLGIGRPRNN